VSLKIFKDGFVEEAFTLMPFLTIVITPKVIPVSEMIMLSTR